MRNEGEVLNPRNMMPELPQTPAASQSVDLKKDRASERHFFFSFGRDSKVKCPRSRRRARRGTGSTLRPSRASAPGMGRISDTLEVQTDKRMRFYHALLRKNKEAEAEERFVNVGF